MSTDEILAFLFWLIHHKRRETGNPWWPLHPVKVRKSPQAIAEQAANVQITVALRHNVGPAETNARLDRAERLAQEAANAHLAERARSLRRRRR